jgi:tRNA G37 N-methylase Trm5
MSRVMLGVLLSGLAVVPAWSIQAQEPAEARTPDVVYVPTPHDVVDRMLKTAKVTKNDVVYDLGCGDGRIVIAAAKKYGCKGVGFEIDPERAQEARENVQKNKVGDLVEIKEQDVFTVDLRPASVITLYLLPTLNVKLIPQLEKLNPGSRIVSHDFDMEGVEPEKTIHMKSQEDDVSHTIYLWTTPLIKK